MRNRTYTRHILVCMLLLLTTIPVYSWYGDYVKDALTPVGLEEFAGGPNIPFPRLSHSAIDTFSALVNRAAGQQVLDAEFYKIKELQKLIMAII